MSYMTPTYQYICMHTLPVHIAHFPFGDMLLLLLSMLALITAVASVSSGAKVCDAIDLCAGGTCPEGMDLVGPPERTDVYRVETDTESWSPGELITVRVLVKSASIVAKRNAGKTQCTCIGRRCPAPNSAGGCDCATCCDGIARRCEVGPEIMETSKYLGLLMYAVKANDPLETKVGSWEVPVEDPQRFAVQSSPGCDDKAVVQTNAMKK